VELELVRLELKVIMLHTHKYLVQLRQKLKQEMNIQVYAQLLLVVLRLQLH